MTERMHQHGDVMAPANFYHNYNGPTLHVKGFKLTNEELAQAIDKAVEHLNALTGEAYKETRNHLIALQKVQLQRALAVVAKPEDIK